MWDGDEENKRKEVYQLWSEKALDSAAALLLYFLDFLFE